jgi:outer membrane protein OmpA-like peptidoglycan-associated protein
MRDYIISKGIDASRISGLGKGESEPAVTCEGSCSKEDHQLNRRCVFKIIK